VQAEQGEDATKDAVSAAKGLSGAQLLDYCVRKVCERETQRHSPPVPVEKQISLMSDLAYVMFGNGSYELERPDSWLRDIAAQDIPAGLAGDKKEEFLDNQVLRLRQHAFLTPVPPKVASEPDQLAFTHPFFRDYLIARLLKTSIDKQDADSVWIYFRGALPQTTVTFVARYADIMKLAGW